MKRAALLIFLLLFTILIKFIGEFYDIIKSLSSHDFFNPLSLFF